MTKAAVLSTPCGHKIRRPSWTQALLARLVAGRPRRRDRVMLDRWPRHMLRDIGLADYASAERPRSVITTGTGWPIR